MESGKNCWKAKEARESMKQKYAVLLDSISRGEGQRGKYKGGERSPGRCKISLLTDNKMEDLKKGTKSGLLKLEDIS